MNDMPECSRSTKRKARKNHKCSNCGAVIEKGTDYEFISGIWSGEPQSFKMCNNCEKVFDNFKLMDKNLGYEDGPTLDRGGIGCWLQDFMCYSWHGEKAAQDIAKLFDVPVDYVRRVCGINTPNKEE